MKWLFLCFLSSVSLLAVTPQEGLTRLEEGNQRYVEDKLQHGDSSSMRREAISSKQEPFAVILGCSDSRVPPELVFDQGLGDLFVVRVAGNVVGPLELDSIEFAVKHLHSALVVVLGHENCGAVAAVLQGHTDEVEDIALLIEPAVRDHKSDKGDITEKTVNMCVKKNVANVVSLLRNSPLLSRYLQDGKVEVVGGFYDLDTGKVEILKQ